MVAVDDDEARGELTFAMSAPRPPPMLSLAKSSISSSDPESAPLPALSPPPRLLADSPPAAAAPAAVVALGRTVVVDSFPVLLLLLLVLLVETEVDVAVPVPTKAVGSGVEAAVAEAVVAVP